MSENTTDSISGGSISGGSISGGSISGGGASGESSGEQGGDSNGSEYSSLVAARGTGDGLVIRVDGRADNSSVKIALADFMASRQNFLTGTEVALEWVGAVPDESAVESVRELLSGRFGVTVKSSKLKEVSSSVSQSSPAMGGLDSFKDKQFKDKQTEVNPNIGSSKVSRITSDRIGAKGEVGGAVVSKGGREKQGGSSLFGGLELINADRAGGGSTSIGADMSSGEMPGSGVSRASSVASTVSRGFDTAQSFWDDPDARVIYGTLRSGQRIESEHTVVICGDVNSGAEIIAGGDIIVLGILRGVTHAGAYDETGGGRFIFALSLQPTQLRIGSTISRGAGENSAPQSGGAQGSGAGPEIARVDGALIVVEPYQAKNLVGRRG